ncbi:MAG: HNH endonuclease [Fimbriimonadaceae bacterium]
MEYDGLGRSSFLAKYGFRAARAYFLELNGRRYDSKAVAGAAHGYLPAKLPLTSKDFSGGERTVAAKLRSLGFAVGVGPQVPRNPPWSRDELILALDLYTSNPASPPGKGSSEIHDLSERLKRLALALDVDVGPDHRNPNGVYMKVMNFRRFDPTFKSQGKVGLEHGSKEDEIVWQLFSGDPTKLHRLALGIGSLIEANEELPDSSTVDPYIEEAIEGRLFTRKHLARERSRELVASKRKQVLAAKGELRCECCGFAFHELYGEVGQGFIEVHHTKAVSTLSPAGEKTRLEDLALLCANCHRMIHREAPWPSVDGLRAKLIAPPQ